MKRSMELVVNPRAGAGRAARVLGDVTRELAMSGFDVTVHRTERPGHAHEIVHELVEARAEVIGVMGGDGSFHEAISGLFDDHGARVDVSRTAFALIPAGTGGDLRKTLGVPTEPRDIARYFAAAEPRPFDLGRLSFVGNDGNRRTVCFANIASFGMSGVVDELVNAGPKWLGGPVAFFTASLRATVGYRNVPVEITVDGDAFYEGPVLTAAVANGRAFGGGMFVAPDADPHDGVFDVVVLGDLTRVESTMLSRHLYRGTHLGQPKIRHRRGRVVEARATGMVPALLDVDGEAPGRLGARFEILPAAIRMLERG